MQETELESRCDQLKIAIFLMNCSCVLGIISYYVGWPIEHQSCMWLTPVIGMIALKTKWFRN